MGFKFPNERDFRQLQEAADRLDLQRAAQEALDQHERIQGQRW